VRTDLQDSLRELFNQRRAGQIPEFDRVIIETTGLADPAPVVQTLLSDTLINHHFRLDGLVTLVDAFHGLDLMQRQPEAIKQIAMADRIFITKIDLATDDVLQTLRDALTALNPRADQVDVLNGDIDPALLTGLGLHSAVGSSDALRFLGEDNPIAIFEYKCRRPLFGCYFHRAMMQPFGLCLCGLQSLLYGADFLRRWNCSLPCVALICCASKAL